MATLGTIESFNPNIEDWNAYSERFEQYMIANDTKDKKKIVATFLTKPSKVKFEELRELSEEAWKKRFPKALLERSILKLRTYTGEALHIIRQAHVQVAYQDQTANLPLQIIKGKGPSLFGRNWLRDIKVNWGSIKKISCDLDNVLTKHKSVFNDELGTMQGTKAKLFVKSGSKPKFFKPRPVPHALKGAIEQELDRLEGMGVIEKVRYSEWAAPIVPVVKPDNSIRVCGDYKITVNSVLEVDQHPLPNPEELFVALSGGVKFSKLDLSRAYQQILLDEDSREYVTINTHKGLYRPTRLPFGVSSASAIFQSKIEQVLQGIPMVVCRVDDILISGKDDQEHLSNLSEVLTRLESAGLRLKLSKCQFMQPTVEYLGYRIDAQGLHAIEKKVEAIRHAPAPENQQQLRSFLAYTGNTLGLSLLTRSPTDLRNADDELAELESLSAIFLKADVAIDERMVKSGHRSGISMEFFLQVPFWIPLYVVCFFDNGIAKNALDDGKRLSCLLQDCMGVARCVVCNV
ncbi:PREDICTED: uncharacterized protein K02A2.6-like [Acropora digitifera]|uniref:uncharacterized protein K02A2.6-like n=1 Tax=Acropora digitifera TaxID=70779 RepID=UPI00077AC635|nr:PREDICTED: uncharacterized protein K02A2.6-like [Acropora digitifera]